MEIKVDTREIRKVLQKGLNALGDMSQAMHNVANLMHRAVKKNFEAEGRDESGRTRTWQPLAPSTQRYRARKKGRDKAAHPILEFNGELKNSIKLDYGKDWAQVYTQLKYGVYHQVGTRKMPARPFFVLPKNDLDIITKYVRDWIEKEMRG